MGETAKSLPGNPLQKNAVVKPATTFLRFSNSPILRFVTFKPAHSPFRPFAFSQICRPFGTLTFLDMPSLPTSELVG